MLGLRVLNHCILSTLKPQENSLAADKQLWKPTLGFVPGHEQRNGLLTGFSSTQAGLLQWQEAFVSISRFLGWILGVELRMHSILSSHTSLPQLGDPPRQEQNPGNVSYAGLQLGDTCSDNQHRGKASYAGARRSHCFRPRPDLGPPPYTHSITVGTKVKIQASVFMSQALTQARRAKIISRWQTFAALTNTFLLYDVFNPFIKELWPHLPRKARA